MNFHAKTIQSSLRSLTVDNSHICEMEGKALRGFTAITPSFRLNKFTSSNMLHVCSS